MIEITLKQLRYALALAEYGHFGRAAEASRVTQPALSQQIRQLETASGAKLFERISGKVRPTPFGREVIAHAKETVKQADALIGFVSARAGKPDRAIKFGLIPTIAPYLLPQVYPALKAHFPKARFAINEGRTDQLLGGLDAGDLDLALIATEPPKEARLEQALLFADPFVLATALTRPMEEPVALSRLDPGEILLLDEGHCFRDQTIDACAMQGAANPATFAATSLSTIVEFVANGQGVTLLPTISLKKELAGHRIAIRALAAPGASRQLRLVWRASSPFSPFFSEIGQVIREAGQSGLSEAWPAAASA